MEKGSSGGSFRVYATLPQGEELQRSKQSGAKVAQVLDKAAKESPDSIGFVCVRGHPRDLMSLAVSVKGQVKEWRAEEPSTKRQKTEVLIIKPKAKKSKKDSPSVADTPQEASTSSRRSSKSRPRPNQRVSIRHAAVASGFSKGHIIVNILQGLQVDPTNKEKQKEFLEEFKKLTKREKQQLFVSSPSSRVRREKRGGPGVQVIIESACKSIVEEYNRACSDLENLKNELATCNQETERREIRKMIERSERVKKDVLDRRRTFEDIEAHSKALASRT